MKKISLSNIALITLTLTTLLSTEATFASANFNEVLKTKNIAALEDPYFQITSVRTQEISEAEVNALESVKPSSPNLRLKKLPPTPTDKTPEVSGDGPEAKPKTAPLDGVIMVVDKLIAIGQKIMPLIDKGRAVVTNNPMGAVAVLPRLDKTEKEVHDMANWSFPETKHYKIAYVNGWGEEVVKFVYSVTFQYNGTFEGKGKYLTGIRASARQIEVSWGFDLDASSQLIQISNIGTSANVVAAATLEISYTVKNWTRTITNIKSFFVTGDGRMQLLDNF